MNALLLKLDEIYQNNENEKVYLHDYIGKTLGKVKNKSHKKLVLKYSKDSRKYIGEEELSLIKQHLMDKRHPIN